MMASTLFNFIYHRSITFKIKNKTKLRFTKFISASAVIILISLTLIYTLTSIFNMWYILSGILVISMMSIISFFLNNNWVFEFEKENSASISN